MSAGMPQAKQRLMIGGGACQMGIGITLPWCVPGAIRQLTGDFT